ncbi:MAG: polysaccharide biosynthesis protein [Phycisphaeraceae bacterium]|nr:MAG: polysaccharide biosynthesis protein [Phycisphaeraceae bacterium]
MSSIETQLGSESEAKLPKPDLTCKHTLKHRAIRGSVWTISGYGISQLLRLGSNLVLTRLLFPEAFGLMAIVMVVITGLAMFSDVGTGPAIVRDKRGDDPAFLNTAWTIQTIRGFVLFLTACALAAPVSHIYGEDALLSLIPVVAITALIAGFNSTAIKTAHRHMWVGRVTFMELIGQIAGTTVMIAWAVMHPSIWALVAGGIVGCATNLVLSHVMLPGVRNKFAWERSAAKTLFNFGKWIFFSSVLFFIAKQGDRMLLGNFVDMAMLGIYAIALSLSEPFIALNMQLARKIVYPALSKIYREDSSRIRGVYYRSRIAMDAIFLPTLGALAAIGPLVVGILYDERYIAAGVMLQVLALRAAVNCLAEPAEQCIVAMGRPRWVTLSHVLRTSAVLIGIPIGWSIGEIQGVLWGLVITELLVLIYFWLRLAQLVILDLKREALAITLIAVGYMFVEIIITFVRIT